MSMIGLKTLFILVVCKNIIQINNIKYVNDRFKDIIHHSYKNTRCIGKANGITIHSKRSSLILNVVSIHHQLSF
jgi:hypothetical protein